MSLEKYPQGNLLEYFGKKLGFSEDQLSTFDAVLDSIKEIMENKVRPNIFKWEQMGSKIDENKNVLLPTSMQQVLDEIIRENRLYTWFIPQEFGGYGYSHIFHAAITEIMSQHDIALNVSTFIGLTVIEGLISFYKPEFEIPLNKFMKGEYTGYVAFTESQAGSNLENVQATSILEGEEYILNGTKILISNGGHANAGLFLCKNIVNGKEEGTNVIFVEGKEGINCERLEDKSGIQVNPTAQMHFDNVKVPKENILSKPGDGYRKVMERLMGMRIGVAMQGIGAAIRAHELAKNYAEQRVQFDKPIIAFDGVSRKIKAMEHTIPRMRYYGFSAGYALDRFYKGYIPIEVGAKGDISEKTAAEQIPNAARTGLAHYFVSTAKLYTSEICQNITYDALQIFGGSGFMREFEINKIVRDVRILPIYEGTSEIHEFLIDKARQALNLIPKFKPISSNFSKTTVYEDILYARFPNLRGVI